MINIFMESRFLNSHSLHVTFFRWVGKREAAAREAAAAAAARAAAQAAAQAAQAAALGRYRLVNAWFYPRGDWYTFY